jgi:hypothetical protein
MLVACRAEAFLPKPPLPHKPVRAPGVPHRGCSSYRFTAICPFESCYWPAVVRAVGGRTDVGGQVGVLEGKRAEFAVHRGNDEVRKAAGIGRGKPKCQDKYRHGGCEPVPHVRPAPEWHVCRNRLRLSGLREDAPLKTRGGSTRCPGTELEMVPRIHVVLAFASGFGFFADRSGICPLRYSEKSQAVRRWFRTCIRARS